MNIRKMTKLDVADVARCHVASWQMAFRGILSDRLLDNLITSQFEENWVRILERPSRVNLVAESKTSILGFVAFGPPNDDTVTLDGTGEIYGIYIHPDHWRIGAGGQLLRSAFRQLSAAGLMRAIVWTMTVNQMSRRFYEKEGMTLTGRTRMSERQSEKFEEVEYMKEMDA
jgi:ribosomal protein S18 acetylase RimI-like enzyme